MSTTHERVDGVVDAGLNPLRAILEQPRQAFVAEGPPSVAVPRHRIVRLLALVLDNADEFVDAMKADFGSRPKAGSWIVVHQGPRHDLGDRAHQIPCGPVDARDQTDARSATGRVEGRGAALAAGCRRNHRPVELSAPTGRVARIGGVRRGQSGHDQDVRDHAQHCGADEVHGAQVLRPERTRHRHGRSRSLRSFLAAAVRPPVLHRFACGRLTGAAGRRAEPRPCHAGVGRQESGGGVAGCRHQPIGCAHRPGANDQRGTGVCLPRLCLRAP